VICPGNHRRWEFMLLPGEQIDKDNEGALSEERLWALLARWLKPGEATIWRAAAYRFHALIAHDWRKGRIFLAGDSAHQTPPFLGQGMCQGLRDAGNLAWKLAAALREGNAHFADRLLDSYAEERRPHVAATTRLAKEIGRLVSERDPALAQARDAALEGGWIARGAPRAGEVFPQPVVLDAEGREHLFDDLGFDDTIEPGYRLVMADELRERDGLLKDWFAQSGCIGALVRPDHYVFGAFANAEECNRLLEMLQSLEGVTDEKRQARPQSARRAARG
jgi:3-(3-hydroxy-phenyl)propionate hydroxylase